MATSGGTDLEQRPIDMGANRVSNLGAPTTTADATYTDNATIPNLNLGTGAAGAAFTAAAQNHSHPDGANWTGTRYYLLDYDGGNDSNVGYVDATAGSTLTPAGLAIKTIQQLLTIMPTQGNAHSAVVLIKPRASSANYLNKSGSADTLDYSAFVGYKHLTFRGSTDLTNSASDQITCGAAIAVAGPGAGSSFTVGAASTTTLLNFASGSISAEPAALQFRIRFDAATATASLQNVCRVVSSHTTTSVTVDTVLPATPSTSDVFYIERPGTRISFITGFGQVPALSTLDNSAVVHIVGIGCAQVGAAAWAFSGANTVTLCFCETTPNSSVQIFKAVDLNHLNLSPNYSTDSGVSNYLGSGFRCASGAAFTNCAVDTLASCGFLRTQAGPLFTQIIGGLNIGARSYFACSPTFRNCGKPGGLQQGGAIGVLFGDTQAGGTVAAPRVVTGTTSLSITSCVMSVYNIAFSGTGNATRFQGTGNFVTFDGCTGNTSTDVGLDFSGAISSTILVGQASANTVTGTNGDIKVAGPAITTHAGLTLTNVIDSAGNNIIGTGVATTPVGDARSFTNNDGTNMAIGDLVRVSGTGNVVKAQADTVAHATGALMVAITPPTNGSLGYFVPVSSPLKWINFDGTPTVTSLCYISPGTAGQATQTLVAVSGTNQKRRLGHVTVVSGTQGLVVGSPELIPITSDGAA